MNEHLAGVKHDNVSEIVVVDAVDFYPLPVCCVQYTKPETAVQSTAINSVHGLRSKVCWETATVVNGNGTVGSLLG